MNENRGKIFMLKVTSAFAILMLSLLLVGCTNSKYKIEHIQAEQIVISYSKAIWTNHATAEEVGSLVEQFNELKILGTTNHNFDPENTVSVIFYNKDKQITSISIDENNICNINGQLYYLEDNNGFYDMGLSIFKQISDREK